MITILIGAAIGFIFGAIFDQDATGDQGMVGAMIGIVPSLIIAVIIGATAPTTYSVTPSITHIADLYDKQTISGSFFLGSGEIDQKAVYYYYGENSDGSFTLNHIDAEGTHIFEDTPATDHPYIKVENCESHATNWQGFWGIGVPNNCPSFPTEIHIPQNSIVRNFSIGG